MIWGPQGWTLVLSRRLRHHRPQVPPLGSLKIFTGTISTGLYPSNKMTKGLLLKARISSKDSEKPAVPVCGPSSCHLVMGETETRDLQTALYKLLRSYHPLALSPLRVSQGRGQWTQILGYSRP